MSANIQAPGEEPVDILPWQGPATDEVFVVTFGEGGAFGVGAKATDSLKFTGKCELRIGENGVRISGKRSAFLKSTDEHHDFTGAEISNVLGAGKAVTFRIPQKDGVMRFVRFEAASVAEAQRIVALLPATRTKKFAAEMAELAEFHQRLDAVTQTPRVTPALVAVNVLVFVVMLFDGAGFMQPDGEVAVRWGSDFGPLTLGGEWWRTFTSMFIHFGVIHLALNMWALYQTGATTERLFGRGRFLALYLFAGLTGSMASLLWNPNVNSAGASGAIFGVFGGLLAFVLNKGNRVPAAVMNEHRNSTLAFAAYSLFYGATHAGVDNAAHVGGLVGGFLIGLLLARPVTVEARVMPAAGRLALSAGAGALMLALMWFPLAHPGEGASNERAYQAYLVNFTAREDAAIAPMKQAMDALTAGKSDEYARLMRESTSKWEALKSELAAIKLEPGSAEAAQYANFGRYLDARVRYCRAAVLAIGGDPQANADATQANADAQAAIEALK